MSGGIDSHLNVILESNEMMEALFLKKNVYLININYQKHLTVLMY